jgi:tetratricopeptide (TPR) repeat protein
MANTDRAWQLFGMHRFDLAEKELHEALAREPSDAMAHAMLGYVLARRGEFSRAHEEVDDAIGRDPESAYAHFVRSWLLGSEKKYEAARLAILEALRIWPNSTAYLDQLSWLELCLNRPCRPWRSLRPVCESIRSIRAV